MAWPASSTSHIRNQLIPLSSSTDNCKTPAPSATGIDNTSMRCTAGVQKLGTIRKRNPTCLSAGSSTDNCNMPATSTLPASA